MSNGTRLIAVVVVVILAAIGLYYAFLYNPPGTSNVPVPVNGNLPAGTLTAPTPPAGGLGSSTNGTTNGEATRTVTPPPPPSGAFGAPTGAAHTPSTAGTTTQNATIGGSNSGTGAGNPSAGGPVPVGSSTNSPRTNTLHDTPPAISGATEYTIQKGDTLEGLARKFFGDGAKWRMIQEANPGLEPSKMATGQKIRIPASSNVANTSSGAGSGTSGGGASGSGSGAGNTAGANTYTVQQGDTLSAIARKVYGSDADWRRILEANAQQLKGSAEALRPGMKLTIPAKR